MTNREHLIALMESHGLKPAQVAELLNVKTNTVRVWRAVGAKEIPDAKLELLRFKLN